jgi:hypothetical protein
MKDQEKKGQELRKSTHKMQSKFELLDFGENATKVFLLVAGAVITIVFIMLIF